MIIQNFQGRKQKVHNSFVLLLNMSSDSEDSHRAIYCCYVYVDMYDRTYYRCSKDEGDLRGSRCSKGCDIWICGRHKEVKVCSSCGAPLKEMP